ncbi:MAG: FAD-dependent thymidylate synthase [Tissierellia bacterium]|nr:FAD-dependent thymidylate synthase [Tissierellia bacterium]
MKVSLLRYTPDGEKLVASAAKLCYSQVGIEAIEEKQDDAAVERFLNLLTDLGHASPVEHISFTFGIEGVARTLTPQLVRHRIASYSQQSQRYVTLENFEYIIPPAIAEDEEAAEIFKKAMEDDRQAYVALTEKLFPRHYDKLIKMGRKESEAKRMAQKQAIEDARYVFPNACETKIVVTMNARSLIHFFNLRCCERAQWEIREMATEMLKCVKAVCPTIFANAGPSCVGGPCPEGAMTCGRIVEIREKFKHLGEE